MPMTFVKPEELDSYVGKSLEPSEWLTIDQERINNFADATNDHQFKEKNPGQFLIKSEVTMELEGSEKPAFIAEQLGLWVT